MLHPCMWGMRLHGHTAHGSRQSSDMRLSELAVDYVCAMMCARATPAAGSKVGLSSLQLHNCYIHVGVATSTVI